MGVDINCKDEYNIFLIIVCFMGYVVVVEILIKVGVNINLSDGNEMFLIKVCKYG